MYVYVKTSILTRSHTTSTSAKWITAQRKRLASVISRQNARHGAPCLIIDHLGNPQQQSSVVCSLIEYKMKDTEQNSAENNQRSRSRSTSKSSKRSSSSRSRSRSLSSDIDGYRLHIADIGDNVRKSELEKYFAQFGDLKELWMTNSSPCFGFAVYKDKKSASAALKEADGA